MSGRVDPGADRVLYDGTCGLCHGAVRFVLVRDRDARFRFAPQNAEPQAREPGTIVVVTADGRRLVRSTAVLYLLARLGGPWRFVALVGSAVPAPLRDAVYRGVARVRHRLFARPEGLCPVVPPHLRARFDLQETPCPDPSCSSPPRSS